MVEDWHPRWARSLINNPILCRPIHRNINEYLNQYTLDTLKEVILFLNRYTLDTLKEVILFLNRYTRTTRIDRPRSKPWGDVRKVKWTKYDPVPAVPYELWAVPPFPFPAHSNEIRPIQSQSNNLHMNSEWNQAHLADPQNQGHLNDWQTGRSPNQNEIRPPPRDSPPGTPDFGPRDRKAVLESFGSFAFEETPAILHQSEGHQRPLRREQNLLHSRTGKSETDFGVVSDILEVIRPRDPSPRGTPEFGPQKDPSLKGTPEFGLKNRPKTRDPSPKRTPEFGPQKGDPVPKIEAFELPFKRSDAPEKAAGDRNIEAKMNQKTQDRVPQQQHDTLLRKSGNSGANRRRRRRKVPRDPSLRDTPHFGPKEIPHDIMESLLFEELGSEDLLRLDGHKVVKVGV